MKCLRIYATPDGESHFDEIDIPTDKRPVSPEIAPFELSAHYPASRIRFARIPAAMREVGYHTVPERVLTVRLDGSVEYETSDGEVRHVQAGSFVLVEDGTAVGDCRSTRPIRAKKGLSIVAISRPPCVLTQAGFWKISH